MIDMLKHLILYFAWNISQELFMPKIIFPVNLFLIFNFIVHSVLFLHFIYNTYTQYHINLMLVSTMCLQMNTKFLMSIFFLILNFIFLIVLFAPVR